MVVDNPLKQDEIINKPFKVMVIFISDGIFGGRINILYLNINHLTTKKKKMIHKSYNKK